MIDDEKEDHKMSMNTSEEATSALTRGSLGHIIVTLRPVHHQ